MNILSIGLLPRLLCCQNKKKINNQDTTSATPLKQLDYVKATKVFRRNKKDVELKILAALLYLSWNEITPEQNLSFVQFILNLTQVILSSKFQEVLVNVVKVLKLSLFGKNGILAFGTQFCSLFPLENPLDV